MIQLSLFPEVEVQPVLSEYSRFIVAFSGGKDSLACILHLLDLGVDPGKIELWHHDVDGHAEVYMDWPCTPAYCRAVAAHLELPIFFSWKVGGFRGEMMRNNQPTDVTAYEVPPTFKPKGPQKNKPRVWAAGGNGPAGTRLKFPQVSGDLRVRWCSAYLKIDIADRAIRGQDRFNDRKTLFVTGERAEESSNRARYKTLEPHRADARKGRLKRHIDHWRPVHRWSEHQVWEIIRKHSINPHPAYRLGWGRVSCAGCIFGSPNQWASLRQVLPEQFSLIAKDEAASGFTIQRQHSIRQLADAGKPYASITPGLIAEAKDREWSYPVRLEDWQLPAGAFGEQVGPT